MGRYPRKLIDLAEIASVVNTSVGEITKEVLAHLYASGAIKVPQQKKKRIDWERLLIYEYISKFYSTTPHWIREEVGPMPPGEPNLLYNRTRRWADAIIRNEDHILVLEGKMKCEPAVIGQLLNYRDLIPQTPMLFKYRELPVKMRVITALITDEVHALLEKADIDVEIYQPTNYQAWYDQVVLKIKRES
jgi:hypothetical protein